jgi:hypothetical protein
MHFQELYLPASGVGVICGWSSDDTPFYERKISGACGRCRFSSKAERCWDLSFEVDIASKWKLTLASSY